MSDFAAAAALALAGAAIAWAGARAAMARPPEALQRTNVSGARVPAVLGAWVVVGGVAALCLLGILTELWHWDGPGADRGSGAALVVLVVMGVAGRWDDRRGDEQPRGFSGHLAAAAGRRLTGGLVKVLAGGAAGLLAWVVLAAPRLDRPLPSVLLVTAAVALSANLVNLLDRAPGRAGKIALAAGLLLAVAGNRSWAIAAAGTLGALAAVLPADLSERGMLGDAGANPLGALLGLGLATSLDTVGLAAAVVVLLLLNLASERWSFSEVIARTRVLRAIDMIGRK